MSRRQQLWNTPNRIKTQTMTIPKSDYLKVFILISLFLISFYTALQKFVFVAPPKLELLRPNFALWCDKYAEGKDKPECENIVRIGYESANIACKGYIEKLSVCMQSQTRGRTKCQTEFSNREGCVNAIVQSAVNKWKPTS